MTAFLKFNALRVLLFVVVLGVLRLLQFRGVLLLLLAAVVSLALSYVLLRGPREELAREIADRMTARAERGAGLDERLRDDAEAEDAAIDLAERDPEDGPGRPPAR